MVVKQYFVSSTYFIIYAKCFGVLSKMSYLMMIGCFQFYIYNILYSEKTAAHNLHSTKQSHRQFVSVCILINPIFSNILPMTASKLIIIYYFLCGHEESDV